MAVDWYLWVLIALILANVSVLILLVFFNKKQVTIKESEINDLSKQIEQLKLEIQRRNQRSGFRLSLPNLNCTFTLIDGTDESLSKVTSKSDKGYIQDISTTGLKLSSTEDLPVRRNFKVNIDFRLQGEYFSLQGLIVRKEGHIENELTAYGIRFIDMDAAYEAQLNTLINRMETEQKSKAKSNSQTDTNGPSGEAVSV